MKYSNIVVCIDNIGYNEQLTIGKKYKIIRVEIGTLRIVNDIGIMFAYYDTRFICMKKYRKQKLSNFLNTINE